MPMPDKTTGAGARRGGFTLVELLVVMFVMSVLVALVVSVGSYVMTQGRKKQTIAKQDRLLAAIDAYRNVTGGVPPHPQDANDSMSQLLDYLLGGHAGDDDARREIVKATRPILGTNPSAHGRDTWGATMRYYRDQGVGGKVLIISPGPDGDFGEYDEDNREDNIRSDVRN